MTKFLLVVMTLFATQTLADEFTLVEREDQQIIKAVDENYNYLIDVDCNVKLDKEEPVDIETSKRRLDVGGNIKVKQDNSTQKCKIRQLAITSVF